MSELLKFLEKKPLYYKAFDPLRMKLAYESIQAKLHLPKIIHIIGTNGKGSTGRYLAQMLRQTQSSVGHYTSPHIHTFNERIWLDGSDIEASSLDKAFEKLKGLLDPSWQESLSYFEFTTLLAIVAFEACDYIVMEAGLGGEYDATAVFDNCMTIVTPIGLDHQDFLGHTLEEIAGTKLRAVRHKAIIAPGQKSEVLEVISKQSQERGFELLFVEEGTLTASMRLALEEFCSRVDVKYLKDNFTTALFAFQSFFDHTLEASKIETIFGRLTKILPNVTVDVGHNVLAAEKILEHFGKSKVNLVYNSLKDKEYEKILTLLKPIILRVEIIGIEDERALARDTLNSILDTLALPYREFEALEKNSDYLVFGSFTVVEAFLKRLNG